MIQAEGTANAKALRWECLQVGLCGRSGRGDHRGEGVGHVGSTAQALVKLWLLPPMRWVCRVWSQGVTVPEFQVPEGTQVLATACPDRLRAFHIPVHTETQGTGLQPRFPKQIPGKA